MRVGIVGAGFGGLAAAIAFHRTGHDVTVFEKASSAQGASAGIALARNALDCLSVLGVRHLVSTKWSTQPQTVRNEHGTVLVSSTLARLAGGTEFAVVKRSRLVDALAAQLPRGCLHRPSPVRGVTADGDIDVDGAVHRFDLVIGADGANSVVRKTLWPAGAALHRTGIRGWSWIADQPSIDGFGSIWGRTAEFGILPMDGGRTYVYGAARPGHADLAAYGNWPDPLPRMIAAVRSDDINTVELTELRPPRRLTAGKVVLIGDAAHARRPTFGQGAALAMEDAITLAYGGMTALKRRRMRTATLYWLSRQGSWVTMPTSKPLAALRDSTLRVIPDRMFGFAAGSVSRWRPPSSATCEPQ